MIFALEAILDGRARTHLHESTYTHGDIPHFRLQTRLDTETVTRCSFQLRTFLCSSNSQCKHLRFGCTGRIFRTDLFKLNQQDEQDLREKWSNTVDSSGRGCDGLWDADDHLRKCCSTAKCPAHVTCTIA